MEKKITYLDKDGYEVFLQSIEDLTEKLKKLRLDKAYAYENSGDGFHDNFAFEEAEREERAIMYEIQEKREQLKNIVIVEKQEEDAVEINDILVLQIIIGETKVEKICKLVSTVPMPCGEETYGYISLNSPIGKAIFHQKIGSQAECEVNGNKRIIIIESKLEEEKIVKKRK